MNSHKLKNWSHIESALRMLKSQGKNHFTYRDVYHLYHILAPPAWQMTEPELRTNLSRFSGRLGIKPDGYTKATGVLGNQAQIKVYTFKEKEVE